MGDREVEGVAQYFDSKKSHMRDYAVQWDWMDIHVADADLI